MESYDTEYKDFLAAASYYDKKIGTARLAGKYGCSDKYIYMVVNGHKEAGRKVQLKFARACGFKTVSDFIQSTKGVKETNNRMINIDNQDDWEHFKVTRKFKNKELAIKANEALVELESIDSIQFAKAVVDIMERLKSAQKQKKEPGRKAAGGE